MIYLLVNLIKLLMIIIPVLIAVAYLTLAERKVLGYMQSRKGPNVVGIYGLLQPLADGVKLFSKEMTVPNHSSLILYFISPILFLTLALVLWGVLPYTLNNVYSELSLGVLFILAISSVSVYAILMSGWASTSKYAYFGSLRAAAQMISYEVSMGLILISVVICIGSLNVSTISWFQTNSSLFIFTLIPAGIMFMVSLIAETNRAPFDLTEGGIRTCFWVQCRILFNVVCLIVLSWICQYYIYVRSVLFDIFRGMTRALLKFSYMVGYQNLNDSHVFCLGTSFLP